MCYICSCMVSLRARVEQLGLGKFKYITVLSHVASFPGSTCTPQLFSYIVESNIG